MDEERLAEIEAYARAMSCGKPSLLAEDMVPELISEVRRLRREIQVIADGLDETVLPVTSGAENAWRRGYARWALSPSE